MPIITFTEKGSFRNMERYLKRLNTTQVYAILNKYGDMGVAKLSQATPTDSGETANAWYYTIEQRKGYYSIRWHNNNIQHGIPVAVLLQYGHGTRNGGFVPGIDYIMPAMRPILEEIANKAWEEVTKI